LNPPHRVKSITMASFTADEIDFIRSRGNEVLLHLFMFLTKHIFISVEKFAILIFLFLNNAILHCAMHMYSYRLGFFESNYMDN